MKYKNTDEWVCHHCIVGYESEPDKTCYDMSQLPVEILVEGSWFSPHPTKEALAGRLPAIVCSNCQWVYAAAQQNVWDIEFGEGNHQAGLGTSENSENERYIYTKAFTNGAFNYADDSQELIKEELMAKNKHKNKTSWGQSSFQSSAGFYTGSTKMCPTHDGKTVVWKGESDEGKVIELAGAQGDHVEVDSELELVIDLAGLFKVTDSAEAISFKAGSRDMSNDKGILPLGLNEFHWTQRMQELNSKVDVPHVLRIKNPDMGIPPVGFDFWLELWNLLPWGRTVCCCVGGHGRTGTALAALILVGDKKNLSAAKAIELVRSRHCSKAIESQTQEKYLASIARERDKHLLALKGNQIDHIE